jgi:hypothetical protein
MQPQALMQGCIKLPILRLPMCIRQAHELMQIVWKHDFHAIPVTSDTSCHNKSVIATNAFAWWISSWKSKCKDFCDPIMNIS